MKDVRRPNAKGGRRTKTPSSRNNSGKNKTRPSANHAASDTSGGSTGRTIGKTDDGSGGGTDERGTNDDSVYRTISFTSWGK